MRSELHEIEFFRHEKDFPEVAAKAVALRHVPENVWSDEDREVACAAIEYMRERRRAHEEHHKRQCVHIDAFAQRWPDVRARAELAWAREALTRSTCPIGVGTSEDRARVLASDCEPSNAIEAVSRFMATPDLRFLILLGGVGSGKTFAAMTALQTVAAREAARWASDVAKWDVRRWRDQLAYVSVDDGFGSDEWVDAWAAKGATGIADVAALPTSFLARMWNPWREDAEAGIEPMRRGYRTLILDDLGMESDNARFHEAFGELVEMRRGSERYKTIITSNLAKPDIRARYGDRIADRLNECSAVVTVTGKSRRPPRAGL